MFYPNVSTNYPPEVFFAVKTRQAQLIVPNITSKSNFTPKKQRKIFHWQISLLGEIELLN